jgi:hypothetical protein
VPDIDAVVTLGRDARAPAAVVAEVNDLIAPLDPQNAVMFTDLRQVRRIVPRVEGRS